jgi:chromosomal replication initiation ATPase DnaA
MGQMLLDLGHRAALGREDFLVAPSNGDAVAWIDLWPNWPAPALVIYGPEACGKTHLAEVWRARSGARRLTPPDIAGREAPTITGGALTLVIEHADRCTDERALLHLFNYVAGQGGTLLLTATTPPAQWRTVLADLRSRLTALPAVAVGAPDDALIQAVMVKQFADRQIRVSPEVIAYLVPRLERSLATVRAVVAALDTAALAERRAVTVPLARQVLERVTAGKRSDGGADGEANR